MIKSKLKIFAGTLLLLIALPHSSLAYFTTKQQVIKINENTALFAIDYRFGVKNYDMKLPIGAIRELESGDASPYVGYQLLNSKAVTEVGESYGVVVSSAKIVDNAYFIPKGHSATFTLYVLAKLPKNDKGESKKSRLSLQISSLPFVMTDEQTKLSGHLNPSELQYYVTDAVTLK